MCSSYPENIHHVVQMTATLQPKSVLDIGMGNGKYGFLLREYFYKRDEGSQGTWKHIPKIDGLDIWPHYEKPHHKTIYDDMFFGNALEMDIKQYDLYLLIDVLEHWSKDEAKKLMTKLLKMGDIIVSTPKDIGDQGETGGNKWERHISQWTAGDFQNMNICEDKSHESPSWIYSIKKNGSS